MNQVQIFIAVLIVGFVGYLLAIRNQPKLAVATAVVSGLVWLATSHFIA